MSEGMNMEREVYQAETHDLLDEAADITAHPSAERHAGNWMARIAEIDTLIASDASEQEIDAKFEQLRNDMKKVRLKHHLN